VTVGHWQAAEKRSLNAKYQMANVKFSIVPGIWHQAFAIDTVLSL
jgi:hypothetical protein